MSVTHRDLAALVAALYDAPGSVQWLYRSNPDANVMFGVVRSGPFLIAVYRGSFTGMDWLRDILVRSIEPVGAPFFHGVHSGFYSGTVEARDILASFITPADKVILIGHSLGAARAELAAEHLVAGGIFPHQVVVWGQPAPFKPQMGAPRYPLISYRNVFGGDEDEVTYSTDIVGYRHRAPFIDVSAPPIDPLPLKLHHFPLYQSVTPATEV